MASGSEPEPPAGETHPSAAQVQGQAQSQAQAQDPAPAPIPAQRPPVIPRQLADGSYSYPDPPQDGNNYHYRSEQTTVDVQHPTSIDAILKQVDVDVGPLPVIQCYDLACPIMGEHRHKDDGGIYFRNLTTLVETWKNMGQATIQQLCDDLVGPTRRAAAAGPLVSPAASTSTAPWNVGSNLPALGGVGAAGSGPNIGMPDSGVINWSLPQYSQESQGDYEMGEVEGNGSGPRTGLQSGGYGANWPNSSGGPGNGSNGIIGGGGGGGSGGAAILGSNASMGLSFPRPPLHNHLGALGPGRFPSIGHGNSQAAPSTATPSNPDFDGFASVNAAFAGLSRDAERVGTIGTDGPGAPNGTSESQDAPADGLTLDLADYFPPYNPQ